MWVVAVPGAGSGGGSGRDDQSGHQRRDGGGGRSCVMSEEVARCWPFVRRLSRRWEGRDSGGAGRPAVMGGGERCRPFVWWPCDGERPQDGCVVVTGGPRAAGSAGVWR